MKFEKRITAPTKTNKNYYSKNNPFYPTYVDNCTWYAWGRQLELGVPWEELYDKLPTSNAENWAHDTKYPVYNFPRVGDIGCYECGKLHHKADGVGHVFVVEHVYDDGRILISESGANMKFQTRIIKPPYKYYLKSNYKYTFKGFIHIRDYDSEWVEGNYKTLKQKYVRKTPQVTTNKVKYNKLPASMKMNCNKTATGYARYKKGVILHLTEFTYDNKGNIWGKNNNYWLCVKDETGKQVKSLQ